jgi:hypothetical protein
MEEGAKRFDFLTNFLKTRHARIKRHKMLSDHDSSKEIALFFEFAAPKFGFLQINSQFCCRNDSILLSC